MTIGERIKQRRIALKMSQDELAKMVGYKSRSSINKIELARDLPLNKVQAVANALEVSPGYLMGWSEDEFIIASALQLEDMELLRIYENLGYDIFHIAEAYYNAKSEDRAKIMDFVNYVVEKGSIKTRSNKEIDAAMLQNMGYDNV